MDKLEELIKDKTADIYKGESDGEDLSQLFDATIWNKLKNRIYDSTLTIVMLSKAILATILIEPMKSKINRIITISEKKYNLYYLTNNHRWFTTFSVASFFLRRLAAHSLVRGALRRENAVLLV